MSHERYTLTFLLICLSLLVISCSDERNERNQTTIERTSVVIAPTVAPTETLAIPPASTATATATPRPPAEEGFVPTRISVSKPPPEGALTRLDLGTNNFAISLSWSPSGSKLAGIIIDRVKSLEAGQFVGKQYTVWDVRKGEVLLNAQGVGESIGWDPSGHVLALGAPPILLLNGLTGETVNHIGEPRPRLNAYGSGVFAWSIGGDLIAASEFNETYSMSDRVAIWRIDTGEMQYLYEKDEDFGSVSEPQQMDFSPNDTRLAVAYSYEAVKIFDVESGTNLHELVWDSENIDDLAWSSDGSQLLVAYDDGWIVRWNSDTGQVVSSYQLPFFIFRSQFSPHGDYLAFPSDGDEDAVMILDSSDAQALVVLDTHSSDGVFVNHLAWSQDGLQLAAALSDGTVVVWEIALKQ